MASAEDIAKSLSGAIGKNDDESTVDTFLDTGYAPFNHALSNKWNGGFACRRMAEMSGPPSAGKTAIATCAMAAAQRMGGIAAFSDHERSFSQILAPNLGLKINGTFIYKTPRTFEDSISLCVQAATHIREKKLIAPEAPIAWVFDSLASMVPQSVLMDMKTKKDRDPRTRNMNDTAALARATSAHFPAFNQYVEELNICAIFLNQVRTKIGVVYGDPRTTPGGDAPKFYSSQRVMLGATKITRGEGESKEVLGSEITGVVIKNKVSRPWLKATWRFMFMKDGTGRFDVERSMIEFLVAEKILPIGKPGFVMWNGVQKGKETLARLIEKEGKLKELIDMLPAAYEPATVAEIIEGAESEPETVAA
jgi:recombination protein RecA